MGNGTSTSQRRYTTYGTRDVRETAKYSNWPELAGAKLAESSGLGRNPYKIADFSKPFIIHVDAANSTVGEGP